MSSTEKRSAVVAAGKKTYLGYLLLDMINGRTSNYFILNDQIGLSLNEYVTGLVKNNDPSKPISKDIRIGGKDCKIHLTKNPDTTYVVSITTAVENGTDLGCESADNNSNQDINFKPKDKYNGSDFLNLCSRHELTFSCNESGKYAFSIKIGEHIVGGPDKIDLYPIHISNLYQMINHVKDGKDINMLIAMATGSGKSFTQALLALVLEMAGYHGVFAVHRDSLISQLKEDFDRLLPISITDKVKLCQKGITNSIDSNSHIITTQDILFKEKSSEFKELFKNNRYWISIDEAHNAAKVELYKKEIEELSAPISFLTATPSEFIAKKVGCIINLSPEEKEKLGICKRNIKKKKEARGSIQKAKKQFKFHLGEKLGLWFANIIEKERLSAPHECIDSIEESVFYRKSSDPFFYIKNDSNDIMQSLRWNTHLPIGKKLLALVGHGSEESIINFHLKLHVNDINDDATNSAYEKLYNIKYFDSPYQVDPAFRQKLKESAYGVYENGNKISRLTTYSLFCLFLLSKHGALLDGAYLREYEKSKKELRKANLCNYLMDQYKISSDEAKSLIEGNVDYSNDAAKYQELNVLHGVIENTISYLTSYDSITLNHKRRHDLDSLIKEVKEKLVAKDIENHKTQILNNLVSGGIPDGIAQEIAEQESTILRVLSESDKVGDDFFRAIVDNWSLDKRIHDKYRSSGNPLSGLQSFCKQHKTVFLVNGMQKTAIKVEDNKPFFRLKEGQFTLHDVDQDELKSRTKHKLSIIEALDHTTKQYYYDPDYCSEEYTEEIIDKLFKKGLIGSYITSEKTTGFNDPNLCNVGVVISSTDENINNPDKLVQSDRNRKLDWAEQPLYHLVTKQGVKVSFDINELARGNYIPALSKAHKKHNEELVKRLGSKIAEQVQNYINDNTYPLGDINLDRLENKLIEIIWKEYNDLYNQNNHDSNKTKDDFMHALNDTYKILYSYKKSIKEGHKLTMLAHVLTFVMELITKILYWFAAYFSNREFKQEIKKLEGSNNKDELVNEKTYACILQNYQYKDIISHGQALLHFIKLASYKIKDSQNFITENLYEFIKEEKKAELNNFIKILLSELIKSTDLNKKQKEEITTLINRNSCLLSGEIFGYIIKSLLNNKNTDLMNIITNQSDDIVFNIIASDAEIKQYFEKEKITKENFKINLQNLPESLINFMESQACVIIKELFDDYKNVINGNDSYKVIDKSKHEKYFTRCFAHYFQSDTYQKLLNYFMSPLKGEHFKAIIDAIYPKDDNNRHKLDRIQGFIKSINNKEEFVEIVKKCGSIREVGDVQTYIHDIIKEILDCYCYSNHIDYKGEDLVLAETPMLYQSSKTQDHKIWKKENSIDCMYHRIQFISGTLKSFNDISEIDCLDSKDKIEHMKSAAEKLKLFIKSLRNPNKEYAMREIEKVASKLSKLEPLKGSVYYNAVQQACHS